MILCFMAHFLQSFRAQSSLPISVILVDRLYFLMGLHNVVFSVGLSYITGSEIRKFSVVLEGSGVGTTSSEWFSKLVLQMESAYFCGFCLYLYHRPHSSY